jgi:immune inhibitor A
MWMNINQTYATPHSMNAHANLPNQGWRKVKPTSTDGVTNVFLLLALAKATNRQAHVTTDSANTITAVYL